MRWRRALRAAGVLPAVGAVLLAACTADDRGGAPAITERVEEGVTVVEHAGLHVADTLSWTIDTTDVVRIGAMDGPEELMIGRLAGYLLRPDGSILLADGIAHELRVFAEDGSFVRKVGGAGEGPGEYGWLYGLRDYAGDSVAVLDNEGGRVTILDPELAFVRRYHPRLLETRARPPMTSHRLIGYFDDGEALMSDYLNVCGPRRSEGFCEDSVAFFRADSAGATMARFGRFVYSRNEFSVVDRGVVSVVYDPHPQAVWAVSGDRFFYGDAKRFEIRAFRSDGTLGRIIRVAGEVPRYPREEVLGPSPAGSAADDPERPARARRIRDFYAGVALPDSFPAFGDLLVDAEDNVWVREYLPRARLAAGTMPRWFVFDPDGHLTHAVRSVPGMVRAVHPSNQLVPQIGADRILGHIRDELGVEQVVLYRLRKGGG